ncbi:2-methoxy-6-polyprenyl-1,4-benzoquinol methylase, mitochondrial-like isoform X5 [Tripterygium wilfordii]|uniref:2-methoxy-6-polyprenyl-1,4-benzoquinol methylase, mitochondrial-like isoform X5 n=1 Tax=Tripterygium wilfordii TaxID=458696 RepID=UPI0018F80000|nr:2-methoxy-6-polyprenyl-1,4-benzoquinol methylase, mitochondrial-like isoform X5 [Tripterygium wilfordii]
MALRLAARKLRSDVSPMRSWASLLHSHATSFGYREVREEEKSMMVSDVFSNVASNYDLMNDLMSGGLHRLWKDRLVSKMNPFPGMKHLDMAGGTGLVEERSLTWVEEDAEALSFEDLSMDGYTIAFGIRNMTHIEKVLAEAYRVLKRGGRFLCLELSHVEVPVFKDLYDHYSFSIIPAVGELIAGDRESYQYLVESIHRFPSQDSKFVKRKSTRTDSDFCIQVCTHFATFFIIDECRRNLLQ